MSVMSWLLIFAKSQLSHTDVFFFHLLFRKAKGPVMRKKKIVTCVHIMLVSYVVHWKEIKFLIEGMNKLYGSLGKQMLKLISTTEHKT